MKFHILFLFQLLSFTIFSQTLLEPFESNGKMGMKNTQGKIIVEPKYDYIENWTNCNDSTPPKWFKFGFNTNTDSLLKSLPSRDIDGIFSRHIPEEYSIIDPNGNLLFSIPKGEYFGLLDSSGKEILPVMFGEIGVMVNNTVKVWRFVAKDRKGYPIGEWGLVHRNGKLIIPMTYEYIDSAYEFRDGFNGYLLLLNGEYKKADLNGNKINE